MTNSYTDRKGYELTLLWQEWVMEGQEGLSSGLELEEVLYGFFQRISVEGSVQQWGNNIVASFTDVKDGNVLQCTYYESRDSWYCKM